jgi:hypothetical protein
MAFTAEQKRAYRSRPEVQAAEREHNKRWRYDNKKRLAEYRRAYRRGVRARGSSTTTTQDPLDGSPN